MTKSTLVAGVAFASLVIVTSAYAVAPWRVFATGNDTGDYAAFASASADAPHSTALAVRVSSAPAKAVSVSVFLSCQLDVKVPSGAMIVLTTHRFKKCSVSSNASTDYAGRVRVELLRR